MAGVVPLGRGGPCAARADGTATAMMVPGSAWKCMNRNPSFGVKHTEKHQNKLFGCSGALGYIPISSPGGCLVQEASVSRGGVTTPPYGGLLPSDPRRAAGILCSCPA